MDRCTGALYATIDCRPLTAGQRSDTTLDKQPVYSSATAVTHTYTTVSFIAVVSSLEGVVALQVASR